MVPARDAADLHPTGSGSYHEPVMVAEVLEQLALRDDGLYLDGTVGGGGHTRAILEACAGCRVIAVDRDPEALAEARSALAGFTGRVRFLHERFDQAVGDPEVRDRGLAGALLDLGVSSHQLDADERGFAFRRGVELDMRMNPEEGMDAAAFLGSAYNARMISALLASVLEQPRIRVLQELDSLEKGLPALRDMLVDGGVLVVIAYHSLEDRIVKHAFREWSKRCVCPPELPVCTCRGEALGETLTRKPVYPSDAEVERNPRARSARLRAWRKAA